METVQFTSINEQVYTILKRRIIERRIPAGGKLDINALAAEFGISRMPIMDAVTRLETEGLVERRNRVGTFVTPLNRAKYEEIYNAREMIEQWVPQAILLRITDEEIADLHAILDQAQELLKDKTESTFDFQKFSERDGLFHLSLIQLCDNAYITSFYTSLNSHVQILRVLSWEALLRSQETQLEHMSILDAYAARDLERVRATQAKHLANSRAGVLRLLEQHHDI